MILQRVGIKAGVFLCVCIVLCGGLSVGGMVHEQGQRNPVASSFFFHAADKWHYN